MQGENVASIFVGVNSMIFIVWIILLAISLIFAKIYEHRKEKKMTLFQWLLLIVFSLLIVNIISSLMLV